MVCADVECKPRRKVMIVNGRDISFCI